jgi:hypothetical protein
MSHHCSAPPPPPLSSAPPTPRRRTPRSSKGRWYKSNVATGSAISLSSVSFVGVFVVIYRQFFKPEKDEDLTVSGTIKVSGKVSITISPPTPPPSSPDPKMPCCDSCASDCTPSRRTCHDSYVQGSRTQAYPGMLYPLLFNLCLPLEFLVIVTVVYVTEPNTCMQLL